MAVPHQCRAKEACTFLGKDIGWEKYVEPGNQSAMFPPIIVGDVNASTIYLTMSSFRDRLCPSTLFYLFTKAAHPERVHVGVVQQNAEDDVDCLDKYCEMMLRNSTSSHCPFRMNIRMRRLHAADAKGPTWARAHGAELMEDEEFCMQTDSHMDFVPDWDVHMIEMWRQTENEFAVLSTYVADSSTLNENLPGKGGTNNVFEVPHLCMVTFSGSYGMVRNWGTKCMRNMVRPKLTNVVWGAGLSFSKCHAERKAPYDPHTPHIFDGEEFSRALRFWTWGYDIYSPHRVYVVHNYIDSQSDPKHSGWIASKNSRQQREQEIQGSTQRLRMLMEMPTERSGYLRINANSNTNLNTITNSSESNALVAGFDRASVEAVQRSRYGLGDRRSLSQAIQFSGIDTRNRKMVGNKCGNLDYVPFTVHPWGPAYVPRFDATTEAFVDVRDPGSIYYDPTNREHVEAWNTANTLYRQGKDHVQIYSPVVPAISTDVLFAVDRVPGAAAESGVRMMEIGVKPFLMKHDSGVIIIVCALIVVVIICARLCGQYRFRVLKTVNACLGTKHNNQ